MGRGSYNGGGTIVNTGSLGMPADGKRHISKEEREEAKQPRGTTAIRKYAKKIRRMERRGQKPKPSDLVAPSVEDPPIPPKPQEKQRLIKVMPVPVDRAKQIKQFGSGLANASVRKRRRPFTKPAD